MVLEKVKAGDPIKSSHHNDIIDALGTKITQVQAESITDEKIKKIVGAAPETLDTLEEVAKAITDNKSVADTLQSSVSAKADKSYVDTELGKKAAKTDLSGYVTSEALAAALKTSDKHTSVTFDSVTNSIVIAYKDGTKTSVPIPKTQAVYA